MSLVGNQKNLVGRRKILEMTAKLKPRRGGGLNTSRPAGIDGIPAAENVSMENHAAPGTSQESASAKANTEPASSSAAPSEPPPAPSYVTEEWVRAQLEKALDWSIIPGPATVLYFDLPQTVVNHELPEKSYYIIARISGEPPHKGLITVER